jgi:multidrug resistance efflux pump
LPDIRVPSDPHPPHHYHPVTCVPLDHVEIRAELQQLRKECSTSVAALKAREEAAKEVKRRIEEAEAKADHLHKLMKRKTEERDTERRVFAKMKKEKGR